MLIFESIFLHYRIDDKPNIEEVIYISGRRNCSPDYLSKYSREQDDDLFDIEYGLNSKNEPEQVASSIGKVLATMVL
ncbi:unnamed protein product [Rotaria sp. Silwood2]|nr:unnamed protein product [Rotaria sp. Silwood2]